MPLSPSLRRVLIPSYVCRANGDEFVFQIHLDNDFLDLEEWPEMGMLMYQLRHPEQDKTTLISPKRSCGRGEFRLHLQNEGHRGVIMW